MIGNLGTFLTACLVMIAKATLLKKTKKKVLAFFFQSQISIIDGCFCSPLVFGGK